MKRRKREYNKEGMEKIRIRYKQTKYILIREMS